MSPFACAVLGTAFGIGGALTAIASRYLPRPRTPAPLPFLVLGYRYCPAEHRVRAAAQHPDGSATCGDCHAHIPAAEEGSRA